MFQIFIIFFREVLEIAIVLSIVNASISHIRGRRLCITIGVILGILCSLAAAVSTKFITTLFSDYDYAQEMVNASLLLISVAMMIWTVVWMKQHSRTLVASIKGYGDRALNSRFSLISLSILTASVVLREGIEIILFSYGIILTYTNSIYYLFVAGLGGMSCAFLVGMLIQYGMLSIPVRYFFKITSIMLSLIAAGMSAQAANFLVAGNILPGGGEALWDSSEILSQNSFLGKTLNILVGYVANPTTIELVFYCSTLLVIVFLLKITKTRSRS